MLKGTCWAEATSNSEKIKPIALTIIELHLSEGINMSVSQSAENSTEQVHRKKREFSTTVGTIAH